MNDLRFACRQLLKNPGITAIAALALVLGIDASTAVSSVVNAVVSGPLAYREPDRFIPTGPFRGGRPAGFVPRMGLLFPRSGCPSRP
jgi:hypothetical protein